MSIKGLEQQLLNLTSKHSIVQNQVLIIFNLQNEFASPDGKLPCNDLAFVNRIKEIVPKFREKVGDIIWIRSEYKTDRRVNDDSPDFDYVLLRQYDPFPEIEESPVLAPVSPVDSASRKKKKKKSKRSGPMSNLFKSKKKEEEKSPEPEVVNPNPVTNPAPPPPGTEELFLTSSYGFERRCGPGTTGADFVPEIKDVMQPGDTTIVASHYSAAKGTDLIHVLRSKLAGEVYICGCISNLSIYATIVDVIGNGFKLRVIEDCLGYRTLQDHQDALRTMLDVEQLGIGRITSKVMHEDMDAAVEQESSQGADVSDKASSMRTRTTTSNNNRDNKASTRSRANPKPSARAQEQDPAAMNKSSSDSTSQKNMRAPGMQAEVIAALNKSTARSSQRPPNVPMLSSDAQAQVLAALGKLSVRDDEESQPTPKPKSKSKKSKSKTTTSVKETNPETSSKSHASPPSSYAQPTSTSDSSIPQAVLDMINQRKTLSEEHSSRAMQTQDKDHQGKGPEEMSDIIEARDSYDESVQPTHTAVADMTSSVPDVDQLSNAPGQKPKTIPVDHPATMIPKNLSNLPTLGPGDKIGEGDSSIRYDLLPSTIRDELHDGLPLSDTIFWALYHEVQWQTMYHAAGAVPRKVAVQGSINADGDKPIYRHPSDQSPPLLPFTKHVDIIRREAENITGHPLNHVLIQLYRSGADFISEHSDKTLDIMPGSKIVNASFGAQRTMRLRTKKSANEAEDSPRTTQRIPLPHNSLFLLGLHTNKIWLHAIQPDKRLPAEKSPPELAYNGMRISLTFRYIGTFLDKEEKLIWGQGAVGRSRDEARSVVNGDEGEGEKLVRAFGRENREGRAFLWREVYGCGFDVLNLRERGEGEGEGGV